MLSTDVQLVTSGTIGVATLLYRTADHCQHAKHRLPQIYRRYFEVRQTMILIHGPNKCPVYLQRQASGEDTV